VVQYGKTKQSSTNGTNFQATISISKDEFVDSKTVIYDSPEVKSSRLCSRSPDLFSQDDEVIENDTPPPTPINGLDPENSIPRKRTRFNSTSRDLDRSPSITRQRTYGRHDISFKAIEVDESPHSSRPNNENGCLTRFGVYDCPSSFGFSSSSSTASGKEYEDLPDLDMPDTLRGLLKLYKTKY
jgi:hypothetical protein